MQLSEPTLRRIKKTACPIYRLAPRATPELIGSAVLLRVGELNFLCTATHVLDARESADLLLPNGDYLEPFAATAVRTSAPGAGISDPYDIAFMYLNDAYSQRFAHYEFVRVPDGVDQDDVPCDGRIYSFVGYPETKNRSMASALSVRADSRIFSGASLSPVEYDSLHYNHATHLVVAFNKKKMAASDGSVQAPPDPHGLSGGPVWRIGDVPQLVNQTNVEKLVGIAIEYRNNALVSVRISVVLEMIRLSFPIAGTLIEDSGEGER